MVVPVFEDLFEGNLAQLHNEAVLADEVVAAPSDVVILIILLIITQQLSRWEKYLDDVGVVQTAHILNFLLRVGHLALIPAGYLLERIVDVCTFVDDLRDLSELTTGYEIQYLVLSLKFLEG